MTRQYTPTQAFLVLSGLPGVGPVTLTRLLEVFGDDPAAILAAGKKDLASVEGVGPKAAETIAHWNQHFDLEREESRLAATGVCFVTRKDPAYPPLLREIHDPPGGLYRLGAYTFSDPCIAIVGSRRTTQYGQAIARHFASELASRGFCIASGLARGIDSCAHEGALSVGGRTVAVLGNGIDIIYPPENLELYRRIAEKGAVLSEFPFGRKAGRSSFAMRNRLVTGMSRAVLVVESDVDGGSMITARFAGEQGRLLCAIPGRIDQPGSRGCHQLIRDGATLVTSVEELLEELDYPGATQTGTRLVTSSSTPKEKVTLEPEEAELLGCFEGGELLTPDAIAEKLGRSAPVVAAGLMMLELRGLVVKRSDGAYEASHRD